MTQNSHKNNNSFFYSKCKNGKIIDISERLEKAITQRSNTVYNPKVLVGKTLREIWNGIWCDDKFSNFEQGEKQAWKNGQSHQFNVTADANGVLHMFSISRNVSDDVLYVDFYKTRMPFAGRIKNFDREDRTLTTITGDIIKPYEIKYLATWLKYGSMELAAKNLYKTTNTLEKSIRGISLKLGYNGTKEMKNDLISEMIAPIFENMALL